MKQIQIKFHTKNLFILAKCIKIISLKYISDININIGLFHSFKFSKKKLYNHLLNLFLISF